MSNFYLFVGLVFGLSITLCHAVCPNSIYGVYYPELPSLTNSGPYNGDWQLTGSDGYLYNWNLCAPQGSCPNSCTLAYTVACQSCSSSPRSLGVLSTQAISVVTGINSVNFLYSGGTGSSACGTLRSSNISVACNPTSVTTPISVTAEANCVYSIFMSSPYACTEAQLLTTTSTSDITTTEYFTSTTMYYPPLVPDQALAMSELQSAWGTALGWTGMASSRACYWPGVACGVSGIYSFVTSLDISDSGLSGTLPASITNFAGLTYLNVSLNKFGGPLPANFSALSSLKVLDCSFAGLTGDFPVNIFSYLFLEIALFQSNAFTGYLPDRLCQVEYYNAQGNQWNCPLPTCCSSAANYLCVPCVNSNGMKQTL